MDVRNDLIWLAIHELTDKKKMDFSASQFAY